MTQTDHKAEYGYEPTWDKQRKKQEELAESYYEHLERKKAERGHE